MKQEFGSFQSAGENELTMTGNTSKNNLRKIGCMVNKYLTRDIPD